MSKYLVVNGYIIYVWYYLPSLIDHLKIKFKKHRALCNCINHKPWVNKVNEKISENKASKENTSLKKKSPLYLKFWTWDLRIKLDFK